MKKFKGTPGRWSAGLGIVISDTPHPSMPNDNTGHSDIEYYGGYLIAESIISQTDAEAIADMPKMLEMIMEMKNEITGLVFQFGQYMQPKDYNRITLLHNRSGSLIDKHTKEEDKANQ